MTLEGTNTWVMAAPGAQRAIVVDPGPDIDRHRDAVLAALRARNVRATVILLTHGHPDHAEGARALSAQAGDVPVRALDPAQRLGSEGLIPGDVVEVDGLVVSVVATPGHTADSLSFHLPEEAAVLTGDTVLGRGTSVVAHPEGRLADYLDSLARLKRLAEAYGLTQVLPGHGRPLDDLGAVVATYVSHRAERLSQVAAAVAGGTGHPREVVEIVYSDVDPALWPAAELSVCAQLTYLRERGR